MIHGEGLYRYDSLFTGAGNRGVDAVTLLLGVPLLLLALDRYRRGSARGALLLLACLGYFAYVFTSMAFGVAWNELFLVYVALLSASRPEWVQADFAIFSAGCITVPVYPSYPPDRLSWIWEDTRRGNLPGRPAVLLTQRALSGILPQDGAVYLDLCDAEWRVASGITAGALHRPGWRHALGQLT